MTHLAHTTYHVLNTWCVHGTWCNLIKVHCEWWAMRNNNFTRVDILHKKCWKCHKAESWEKSETRKVFACACALVRVWLWCSWYHARERDNLFFPCSFSFRVRLVACHMAACRLVYTVRYKHDYIFFVFIYNVIAAYFIVLQKPQFNSA